MWKRLRKNATVPPVQRIDSRLPRKRKQTCKLRYVCVYYAYIMLLWFHCIIFNLQVRQIQAQKQPLTSDQILPMTVVRLKLELKARGLNVSGKKSDLREQLTQHKDLLPEDVQMSANRHYCGCLNVEHDLVTWLRNANMKLLIEAGKRKNPEWYRQKLQQMFVCLTKNTHEGKSVLCNFISRSNSSPTIIRLCTSQRFGLFRTRQTAGNVSIPRRHPAFLLRSPWQECGEINWSSPRSCSQQFLGTWICACVGCVSKTDTHVNDVFSVDGFDWGFGKQPNGHAWTSFHTTHTYSHSRIFTHTHTHTADNGIRILPHRHNCSASGDAMYPQGSKIWTWAFREAIQTTEKIVTEEGRKKLTTRHVWSSHFMVVTSTFTSKHTIENRKIIDRNSWGSRRLLSKLTKRALGFDDNFGLSHASKDGQVRTRQHKLTCCHTPLHSLMIGWQRS